MTVTDVVQHENTADDDLDEIDAIKTSHMGGLKALISTMLYWAAVNSYLGWTYDVKGMEKLCYKMQIILLLIEDDHWFLYVWLIQIYIM